MWTASALVVAPLRAEHANGAIIVGLVLLLLASLGIALTVDAGPVLAIAIAIGCSGAGIGCLNNPAIQHIIAAAPAPEKQIAGTSVQAVRNIGISFGAAASGTVAASAGLVDGAERAVVANAMEWVFGINVVVAVIALAIAIPTLARRNGSQDVSSGQGQDAAG
jgi:MFS family permease